MDVKQRLTERNQEVEKYSLLVRGIAHNVARACYANVDDLIGEGIVALIESVEKSNSEKRPLTNSYVALRTKGAMIDYLRKYGDDLPRSSRVDANKVEAIVDDLRKAGKEVSDEAIANKLGVDLNRYYKLRSRISTRLISVDELGIVDKEGNKKSFYESFNSGEKSLEEAISLLEEIRPLYKAVQELSHDKRRIFLQLYYFQELKMKEIAKIFDVSQTRVSQIHFSAIKDLREKLQELS